MRNKRGFTLLELLMVVVIIAILAAIAVPQYLKTTERARMAEAISMLGTIRNSLIRYVGETGGIPAPTLAALDIDVLDVSGTPAFTYDLEVVVVGPPFTFTIRATRGGLTPVPAPCLASYMLRLDDTGALSGRTCQTTT